MEENKIVDIVSSKIKVLSYNEETGHDWWHVERVLKIAENINNREKADKFTVKMIALLHDLYDEKFSSKPIQEGIIEFLQGLSVYSYIDENKMKNIIESVKNIGYKGGFEISKLSKEGKIVQDADRIDALGAIGIARVFAYGGKKERQIYNPDQGIIEIKSEKDYRDCNRHSINHFYEKLLKIKDTMNTKKGLKIAKERTKYMEKYLKKFYEEWNIS